MPLLSGFRKRRILKVLKQEIQERGLVLDLGCGDGQILKGLDMPGVGVDLNLSNLKKSPKCDYVLSDLHQGLPFKSEQFDYVTLCQVVEHLNPLALKNLISEIMRVLKPGGKVIILTPNPTFHLLLKLMSKLNLLGKFEHLAYYTIQGLKAICISLGLEVIKAKSYNLGLDEIVVAQNPRHGQDINTDESFQR